MGRYIFNGVTGLSFIICIATVVLWVRSYRTADIAVYSFWRVDSDNLHASGYRHWLDTGSGALGYCYECERCEPTSVSKPYFLALAEQPGSIAVYHQLPRHPSFSTPTTLGFSVNSMDLDWSASGGGTLSTKKCVVPIWFLCLLLALLPVTRVGFRILRGPRHRPDHCPNCHYDLRATPSRCPECGHAPTDPAEKRQFATENTEYTEEE